MLHDKSIKSIKELQTDFHADRLDMVKLMDIFKAMKLTEVFSEFNHFKQSGYSFKLVLSLLTVMIVTANKTVRSSLSDLYAHGITIGKDVFYRLKNNEQICWRRILWHISMKFIHITASNNQAEESKRPHYLIFDDTTIEKSGKKMEFLGRVWDHVKQRSILGFKILVMLYWDGKSSIPLDFSIHREQGKRASHPYGMRPKELRRQYHKKREKESESIRRIKELDSDKLSMTLKMFYLAVSRCLKIDYVLVDSWFTCDALIKAVVRKGLHLIGMYKIAKTKFLYQGKTMSYSEINSRISKSIRCRSLGFYYKRAEVMYDDIRLTLFFSRRGKRGDWKVLLTTDTSLSFIQLIEHYQVRWTIEVFNKEAKGLLNLGGCQSSNFDAQIADTTISMIAYILLSFRFRLRLWGLFLETIRIVAEILDIDADGLLKRVLTNSDAEQMLSLHFENNLKQAS
jgi:predicted nucleic acid-binding Zn finger protein